MSCEITLYNCEKKELIGVFRTERLAAKYLYPMCTFDKAAKIYHATVNKNRIQDSPIGFDVAARQCNKDQIKMLGKEDYVITKGYPSPNKAHMKGFSSNQHQFYTETLEKIKVLTAERKKNKSNTITFMVPPSKEAMRDRLNDLSGNFFNSTNLESGMYENL